MVNVNFKKVKKGTKKTTFAFITFFLLYQSRSPKGDRLLFFFENQCAIEIVRFSRNFKYQNSFKLYSV